MKRILFPLLALIAGPLAAEQFENIEFQFPPSNNEWKLWFDKTYETEGFDMHTRAYTHREGDALEIFLILTSPTILGEEDDDESEIEEILAAMGITFPNHQFITTTLEKSDTSEFEELEWSDGVQDIMHGFARTLIFKPKTVVMSYFTTAAKHEANQFLWTNVLNKAVIIDQHQLTE